MVAPAKAWRTRAAGESSDKGRQRRRRRRMGGKAPASEAAKMIKTAAMRRSRVVVDEMFES
jgi:hypothetical protein